MPLLGEKKRAYERGKSRERTAEEAEIGPPPLSDEQRLVGEMLRSETWDDLEAFNVKVFPNSTGLKPLGTVQKDSIAHDQSVIMSGGRICKAEPRAYGKTTRTCNAAMWGLLTGRRQMIPIFSANMEKSRAITDRWKTEIASNDMLFWMFPELIWPLRSLENRPQRCASQTFNGVATETKWRADRIVFPSVPGVIGSGSVLIALPLKNCRGATHSKTTRNGSAEVLRPDLLIFDDVQTDEDATNPNTVRKLEELIDHAAMLLGGHSQTMSAIMNCTVRRPDDLSEIYLKKPSWRRVRYKMLASPSEGEKEHWLGRYADIRTAYDPESPNDQGRAHKDALSYYLQNREAMDRGAVTTWDWAFAWKDDEPTEVSSVQHAYNILIDSGESVFSSECQNEPLKESGGLEILTADQIAKKQSGYAQGRFPPECTVLTAKIDVHPSILYWEVWAWEPNFTGYCIDYGTFPDQKRRNFSHHLLARKLGDLFPGRDVDATVTAGLDGLVNGCPSEKWEGLLRHEWRRTDDVFVKISKAAIDASGEASDAVKKFIRQSEFSAMLSPSYGRGVTENQKPISQWQQSIGQRNMGPEWVLTKGKPGEPIGEIYDTNYWKTRFHRALALPNGSQGAIYLYKAPPTDHRRVAEHWSSEKCHERVGDGGRTVFVFYLPPGRDNHDLDCGVGAMVEASRMGITNIVMKAPAQKPRMSLAEMKQAARR